jgi:hypothetical protein
MLEVDFGTEVYPCWVDNVDRIPDGTIELNDFSDVEITTFA